jgi:nitroreductase
MGDRLPPGTALLFRIHHCQAFIDLSSIDLISPENVMEFLQLLTARHSVRRYQPQPVPHELVSQILEAIRTAPTAGNFQAYQVYAVRGAEQMQKVAAATFDHGWVAQAPLALVICTDPSRCQYDGPEHWALQDASIAATIAHLAAASLGLGSCWVGAFAPQKLAEVIHAADGHTPLALVTIGYADEQPQPMPRRELAEFVHEVK